MSITEQVKYKTAYYHKTVLTFQKDNIIPTAN